MIDLKGIVFNLLEQVITRNHGEDTWDTLLETAQLDGIYTSLGNPTDEDFWAMAKSATVMNVLAVEPVTGRGAQVGIQVGGPRGVGSFTVDMLSKVKSFK